MATFIASQGFNINAVKEPSGEGDILRNASSTGFTWQGENGVNMIVKGSGFTFDAYGDAINGTVNSLSMTDAGKNYFTLSGITNMTLANSVYDTGYRVDGSLLYGIKAEIASAMSANDAINGSAYSDILAGFAGNDTIKGNDGNDRLEGWSGNDSLLGGNGNDTLIGGSGNDSMNGGAGNDQYFVDSSQDVISGEAAATGTDGVYSSITYTLGASSYLENLTLLSGATNATGNSLNNTLTGNTASNTLSGNAGNDVLIGGLGRDLLIGGAGSDRFDFNSVQESGLGSVYRDVISDFKSSEGDKLDLSTIDANSATASNDAFSYIGSAGFSHAGQLKLIGGILYGNTDADAAAEFEIQLTGVTALNSTAFIL
ncbi:calcium-binding protein [Chitinilyticum piscinae]|uniref:Type I secretion C-terminal target domain-containing protein n=1 Tax=Chitinilyticum piscinae TaxID=2866724 RepID=A0A8J7FMF0_9NEIS|nr:calcium-binding protein [Chitinilyticum piscinae]MBE9609136.1 type I secretion C-terminal target domain-containing protein [Chitinilyticum piscinae]